MKNKKRGSNAERELLHLLWQAGFAVARVAGSGSIPLPSCDLLAGKKHRKYAIECKIARNEKRYIDGKQLNEFLMFAEIFGLKPIIAIKFLRKGWFFINAIKLNKLKQKQTKQVCISFDIAKKIGKNFEEFVKG